MRVNEHFEPIFNAVWCQLRGFKTASKADTAVERAGIKSDNLSVIRLHPQQYEAEVALAIGEGVRLQEDAIASMRTLGHDCREVRLSVIEVLESIR